MRWLDGIINSMGMNLSKFRETVKDRDWLSLPRPPKMAPFTQLRGFRASRPWRGARWLGGVRPRGSELGRV